MCKWFGNILGSQVEKQTFDCSWPKEGQPIKCLVSNWQPLYYAKISKTVKYLVLKLLMLTNNAQINWAN